LVWFGLVWFGLVWFGLVWFGVGVGVGRDPPLSIIIPPVFTVQGSLGIHAKFSSYFMWITSNTYLYREMSRISRNE